MGGNRRQERRAEGSAVRNRRIRQGVHGTPHPGDPIVADLDCSVENLPEGSLIHAGTAVLRVSDEFNAGCVKWKARYGADARAFIDAPGHPPLRLRGILCAVAQDGEVTLTDRLQVIRRGA